MTTPPFDGNAAAGDLSDVFAFDVTMARTTCAVCGDTRPPSPRTCTTMHCRDC